MELRIQKILVQKLIRGIIDFRKNVRPRYRETFANLALAQKPDALLVTCSDSRVAVNLFASTEPGDLFVVRNMGNIVPPFGGAYGSEESSVTAALEFALDSLQVKDIIVCGHSECGAMQSLCCGHSKSPYLKRWLRFADSALHENTDLQSLPEEAHNKASQRNVLLQMENLKTHPSVAERMRAGSLRIHGWWFELRNAEVYFYDASDKKFRVLDQSSALSS